MKNVFKVMAGILVVIIVAIAGLAFYVKYRSGQEIKLLRPAKTQKINEEIDCAETKFSNIYFVKSSDGYIAFDAGNDKKIAEEEMRKLGIKPQDVKALFLSHTDWDHVQAVSLFSNAKIYISKEEEKLVSGKVKRALIIGNTLKEAHTLLKDKETVYEGNIKVEALLTPGHTIGSMVYIVNDKYMFTGDTLSLKNGKVDVFNEFFNMDTRKELESILKISGLNNYEYIFTAHYGFAKREPSSFNIITKTGGI